MSLESQLFDALKSIVSNRVYPVTFLRANGVPPVWPSIRYSFVSIVPAFGLCGDSGDDGADTRLQIDCVALTYAEARSVRDNVMAAMVNFLIPAIYQDTFESYDQETKTYRTQLDYVIYKSSDPVT
jgi:hypothetical protein